MESAFNTISAFTETDPKTARRMMARLGALLRSSLDHAGRQEVTLAEELRFLDDYLTIERLRFEDRLTVEIQVEYGVRDALVPSFVLQAARGERHPPRYGRAAPGRQREPGGTPGGRSVDARGRR
jgi:LytS/YehU family sensor histidine kinase